MLDMSRPPASRASRPIGRLAGHVLLGHVTYSLLHPVNQQTATEVSSPSVAKRDLMPSSDRDAPLRLPTRNGGGERDRTDDLLLAKQALSQLSYTPGFHKGASVIKWWAREDLNLRPHAYQARALTS